jgi:hypothetical protein
MWIGVESLAFTRRGSVFPSAQHLEPGTYTDDSLWPSFSFFVFR